jgi:hypothetical protein
MSGKSRMCGCKAMLWYDLLFYNFIGGDSTDASKLCEEEAQTFNEVQFSVLNLHFPPKAGNQIQGLAHARQGLLTMKLNLVFSVS